MSGVLVFAIDGNPRNKTIFRVCVYICQQNCHKIPQNDKNSIPNVVVGGFR